MFLRTPEFIFAGFKAISCVSILQGTCAQSKHISYTNHINLAGFSISNFTLLENILKGKCRTRYSKAMWQTSMNSEKLRLENLFVRLSSCLAIVFIKYLHIWRTKEHYRILCTGVSETRTENVIIDKWTGILHTKTYKLSVFSFKVHSCSTNSKLKYVWASERSTLMQLWMIQIYLYIYVNTVHCHKYAKCVRFEISTWKYTLNLRYFYSRSGMD